MRTQTKCTIALCCLFIVEIFPLPFTALISLYTVRKRSNWLPISVANLYADKPTDQASKDTEDTVVDGDGMATRRKCTITLIVMTIIDLIIPVTIPTGLYIVRKRPQWFKNTIARLYAGQPVTMNAEMDDDDLFEVEDREIDADLLEKKYLELERNNLRFARSTSKQ